MPDAPEAHQGPDAAEAHQGPDAPEAHQGPGAEEVATGPDSAEAARVLNAKRVSKGLDVADKTNKVLKYAAMTPGAILLREGFNRAFGVAATNVSKATGVKDKADHVTDDTGNEWSDLAAKEARTEAYKRGRGVARDRAIGGLADAGAQAASAAETALEGKALAGGAGLAAKASAAGVEAQLLSAAGLAGASIGWQHVAGGAAGAALLGGSGGAVLAHSAVAAKVAVAGKAVGASVHSFWHGPHCAAHPVVLKPLGINGTPKLVHGGKLSAAQKEILLHNTGKFTTKRSSEFI